MKTERGIHGWRRLGLVIAGALGAGLIALPAAASATLPGQNGRIVFDRDPGTTGTYAGIFAVSPDGSHEKDVRIMGPGDSREPAISPDGAWIAYVTNGPDNDIHIRPFSNSDDVTPITNNNVAPEGGPAFLPDGATILYHRDLGGIFENDVYSTALDGSSISNLTGVGDQLSPDPSPGGTKIAYSSDEQIWIMNPDGSGKQPVTTAGGVEPSFSPDGTKIAFASDRAGSSDIYVINADGSGERRLTSGPGHEQGPSFSPDGTKIAYAAGADQSGGDLYVMNADGSGQTPIVSGPDYVDDDPHWVPLAASYGVTEDGVPGDTDGDGVPDSVDALPLDPSNRDDADGDGVPDAEDAFPHDPAEHRDSDGDGIGDNADTDDDNDGIPDAEDAFPLDPGRSIALTVKAKPKQAFDRLVVRVGCGAAACTVRGSGKAKVKAGGKGKGRAKGKRAARHVELRKRGKRKSKAKTFKLKAKPKRAQIAAGKTKKIRLAVKGKGQRKLGRLLKRGKGSARIKLRASTPAGAEVGATVKVKLKKSSKRPKGGKRGKGKRGS